MKKLTLFVSAFVMCAFAANAQCDKKIKWNASKMEMVDTSGNVRSKDGIITVITGDGKIVVTAAEDNEQLSGGITDYVCNWKDRNNGSMSFKSLLTDTHGKERHATITIEAKDGKTVMVFSAEEELTKMQLPIDAYEEIN
ncbi:hypothetical protein [Parafilimonas terrae]|jgi:hypothetical protein|uniref:Lipocalin-like domain-containing protein n=1 Tax=Parafilimonas terrae TaxID=1465490 RepID=A0A1I5SJT7_9BACT|nr:hypothetical protein [Parafilimonas terrae]SFP70989.1 hypothetical protein SAMN05444277_101799 [Parafilimonas terrae]